MKKLYFLLLALPLGAFAQVGALCNNPNIIGSLPYTTTDNTANYADNYDPSTSASIACGSGTSGNYYLSGNDVIYAFTPTQSAIIKIEIPSSVAWTGLFVYTDCSQIGTAPYACNCSSSGGNRTINNLSVTAGQTYYIVISSWSTPQTIPYTLNVTLITLGVESQELKNPISLYPNPAEKELFFDASFEIKNARIYNLNGQLISAVNVSNNKITVDQLSEGFYLIELENKEGLKSKHKFIKK